MRTSLKLYVNSFFSNIRYIDKYVRGGQMLHDSSKQRDKFNKEFLSFADQDGKKCMQVGVRHAKNGKNWVVVDLYDTSPLVDYRYDIRSMGFEDNTFDGIACSAILEHVDDPVAAIKELYRVLKPGGRIWIEVPLNQPYHPSPQDYWRVTPDGMKVWMKEFKEIFCGGFFINRSTIYTGTFFYGEKSAR